MLTSRPEARVVDAGVVQPPSLAEWQVRQAEVIARQDRIRADLAEQIEMNRQHSDARSRTAFDTLERMATEFGNGDSKAADITPAEVALIVIAAIVAVVGIVNTIANWGTYAAQW